MLPFLRKKRHGGWLTVLCRSGRIELAHVVRPDEGAPVVQMLEVFNDEGDVDGALARLRAERKLDAYQCVTLLDEQEYRLVLTENPSVPEEELLEALRWRLKDAVDFPVVDASIAVLQLVNDQPNARMANVFVVAAPRVAVATLMGRLNKAKLGLEAVDIPETALRNVAALFETENRGLGFLYLAPNFSSFIVTYRGEMLLSRRMDLSASQLLSADKERREQLIERLGLELQRTLDNFDRQFSFVSLSRIVIACAEEIPEVLVKLGDCVYFPLQAMDLATVLEFPAIPELRNPVWQAQCLLSIGAALRDEA
jgi:MSHA biogenesis protein MshI